MTRLKAAFTDHRAVRVYSGDPAAWPGIFRILQGDEIRRRHGAWIDEHNPRFGPGIAERFRWTRSIDPAEVERMRPRREDLARHMDALLGDDAMLCLPTAPGIAPKLATPAAELEAFRARAFALLSIAGLARLPQLSLPLGAMDGCPLGLSLIAPRGCDLGLLDWAAAYPGRSTAAIVRNRTAAILAGIGAPQQFLSASFRRPAPPPFSRERQTCRSDRP